MKSRSLLALALIISLAVLPSLQLALAASTTSTSTTSTSTTSTTSGAPTTPYSQRLDIYLAGTSDLWLVKLSPVNDTKAAVVAAESVAGVSAYEMITERVTAATASSQLFWGDGYHILPVPYYADQGVFLNVTANSQAAATQAATDFDHFIATTFVQTGVSGDNYTFFSPGDFTLAGEIMYSDTVPSAEKGLAEITSAFSLAADPTPTDILTGVRGASGTFTHSFTFGSFQTDAVGTNGSLTLAKGLNYANDSFLSAASPGKTFVDVHVLDGLVSSPDAGATVTNHVANYSSSYTYNVPADTRFRPNLTVLQDPPVLSATRLVSTGSVAQGGLISLTLLLKNRGEAVTIDNVSGNDTWWTSYPSLFSLSAGTSSFSIPTIADGQSASDVYVLKVDSSASEDITVPPLTVQYSYSVGNTTVTATTQTNELEIRTNDVGPALVITATASVASGVPLGTVSSYIVRVNNTGNAPALDLVSGSFTQETLVQGGSWSFNMTIPQTSLIDRNITKSFSVGWEAPDGTKGSLQSNPVNIVFSHTGVVLPLMSFNIASTLTPQVLSTGVVNATYTLTNGGSAPATNVTVSQAFPKGMNCVKVLSGTATCTSSEFSLQTQSIAVSATSTGQLATTFGTDNYISEPGIVTTNYNGLLLHTAGAGYVVPAGVVVTRVDSPNPLFEGQNDTVTVEVVNKGTSPVYNVSLSTDSDVFDRAVRGTLYADYPVINGSAQYSYNYTVTTIESGNHTTSSISLGYAFGGFTASYNVFPGTVLIYKDVTATTTTKPSTPIEGNPFSLAISIQNPSKVNVTGVSFSIPVPKGFSILNTSSDMQVHGRTIELSLASLAPGVTSTHFISLKSGADGSFSLGTGTLTFNYLGTTVNGVIVSPAIVVGVDLLLRYELPIAAAVVLIVLMAFYVRRKLPTPAK